ncbi:hypothetical protein J2X20_002113 [Pelomonas saccharophila]|uniref:Uncharacterized protein n=1 Tax=Roseateles saccharophilus TaxID=304 RepID=A0ABU1YKU6_ROSSA|nr:hypothetical protein [Roseateles saccharophilus]
MTRRATRSEQPLLEPLMASRPSDLDWLLRPVPAKG